MTMLEEQLDMLTSRKTYQSIAVVGDASIQVSVHRWLKNHLHVENEHPDIIVLEGEDGSPLGIDGVRSMIERLRLHPFSGSYYVIIPRAHLLTRACANALLKVLEEPERAYFFLITPHMDALLATIRSRSVQVDVCEGLDTENTEVLQKDLDALVTVFNPLSVSEKWQAKTSSAAMWLELFWKVLSTSLLSEQSAGITVPQRLKILALSDSIIRYTAVNARGGVVNHKRIVEYSLIRFAEIFHGKV